MATLVNLVAIGYQQNLEAWWYPVWDKMLQVYVAGGYVGTGNLAVGPQSALRSPGGGGPYLIPDFTVFEAPRIGGAGDSKTLRMVMECKRGGSIGEMIAAESQVQDQMVRAVAAVNDPPTVVGQPLWGIATAGDSWTWFRTTLGPGGGWSAIAWAGVYWNTTMALNTQVPI